MAGPLNTIVDAVRRRRISATDVVTASLEALARHDPTLGVLAASAEMDALAAARASDLAGDRDAPLAGAPLLVKDLEDWAGHRTVMGSRTRIDAAPAGSSSPTVARLLAAGAIGVGKSTLPEFAIEGYTANLVTGVTRNPWDPALSPGGSSGGSGAALAAGLVAVATATDGGGSVRIPASLCGLLGLKPTTGALGRWPAPDWIDYSSDGILATSADDLALLFATLRGGIPGDPGPAPLAPAPSDERPVRLLATPQTSSATPLAPEVASALATAVAALADVLGAPVTWLEPSLFVAPGDLDADWYTVCASEHVAARGRARIEREWDLYHPATRAFFSRGLATTIDEYLAARRRRFAWVRLLDDLLGDDGLLVSPVVTRTGWPAEGPRDESGSVVGLAPDHLATVLQNVTGVPAISIPMGRAGSLPFGLQVTAPRGHDAWLMRVAARVEAALPWPLVAPGHRTLAEALGLDDPAGISR